jgi:pyruvate dehydrogenase E2 component (dihydrolipoamide acetyltransferase)
MPMILTLPKIGVNMTEATIVRWLVKEGEYVEEEQTILEAETDKATQEIPSTKSGILAKIVAQPGETVQTQEPIAVLTEKGEVLPSDFKVSNLEKAEKTAEKPTQEVVVPGNDEKRPAAGTGTRVRISPIAKKLAQELDLDYTQITPSRPGGRVEKADVLAFASEMEGIKEEVPRELALGEPAQQAGVDFVPMKGIRKTIATRLSESAHTTARAVLFTSADAEKLILLRSRLNKGDKKVSFNDIFVYMIAKALVEFPKINARLEGDKIRLVHEVNVGVAVETERGLMVPVIHSADGKDIVTISEELQQKIERARNGKSIREDITGGTFTITNLGMFDVESFIPIINPPECAILAIGAIMRKPVVVDDKDTVAVRPGVQLSLVFDHRLIDGAPAAQFLQRVKKLVETCDSE